MTRIHPVVSGEIIYWKTRFPGNFKFYPTLLLNILHEVVAHELCDAADGNQGVALANGFGATGTSLQEESHRSDGVKAYTKKDGRR